MELTEYRQCVLTPVSSENSVGQRLIDEPLFDFVEEQMMKVGSLSHASVQWVEVEHSVLKLMKEKSKDLKLVIYLLQCLHNRMSAERFITSIWLLADFMESYWEVCYPAPGKRGALPRRKFFSQITQRLSSVIEKVDLNSFDIQAREELSNAFNALESVVINQNLMTDAVEIMLSKVRTELKRVEERKTQTQSQKKSEFEDSGLLMDVSEPTPVVSIDHSSDKSSKQTLFKVSDFLFEQDFGQELSVRLRRFAVWSSIISPPDHSSSGETLLRSIPRERVKEYREQMRSPDLALWRKIESNLVVSPYWFEGQLMSYQVAKHLDHMSWCKAIWDETYKFIERLPILMDLKYKDGVPFVSEEVKQWLQEVSAGSGSAQTTSNDWDEKRNEAFALAKEGGIAVALSMLNDGLESTSEPRDRFYFKLLVADLLKANNLDAMAEEHYLILNKQVNSMTVTDWEPSLVERLEKLTAPVKLKG